MGNNISSVAYIELSTVIILHASNLERLVFDFFCGFCQQDGVKQEKTTKRIDYFSVSLSVYFLLKKKKRKLWKCFIVFTIKKNWIFSFIFILVISKPTFFSIILVQHCSMLRKEIQCLSTSINHIDLNLQPLNYCNFRKVFSTTAN